MTSPLALCYGTRPQVIKASLLAGALARDWPLVTIDTGQHYDYELNAGLYQQLGVARPDHFLESGSGSLAEQTSLILTRSAAILAAARPLAAVVIGDTNSTLGCALAAVQLRIPVVHVEAGLRAADHLMAEEVIRRVVDVMSAVLCAPSPAAEQRLNEERVTGRVEVTGDIARDVLERHQGRAPAPESQRGWPLAPGQPFAFATLHRAELTGDAAALRAVLEGFATVELPIVLAAHPRLRQAFERHGLLEHVPSTVHVLPPLGYLEALACVREARIVLTDSGGLQREAYWLGTPCLTLRRETEWRETVALGANAVMEPARAPAELAGAVRQRRRAEGAGPGGWDRDSYGRGDAARRIVAALHRWLPSTRS